MKMRSVLTKALSRHLSGKERPEDRDSDTASPMSATSGRGDGNAGAATPAQRSSPSGEQRMIQSPQADGHIRIDMAPENHGEGSRFGGDEGMTDRNAGFGGGEEDTDGEDDDDSEGRGGAEEEVEDEDDDEVVPSSKEDLELEAKFEQRVGAMKAQDFDSLQRLEFLTKAGRDLEGRRLFRVVGKFLPVKAVDLELLTSYVHYMFHRYARDGDFCVVYIHTEAASENSPGTLWLQSLYRSLPPGYRRRLRAVYILHPALLMRLTLWGVTQYLGDSLAHKLVYVSRIEFLWDYMKERHIALPDFVKEHDRELESRPLMDYGLDVDEYMTQSMVNMR